METLLMQALSDAFDLLEKQVPQTKKKSKSISIRDVNPLELTSFMKKNGVPKNATFGGTDNGYDGWSDIVLEWYVDVPTTQKDKLDFRRNRFTTIAFKKVYDLLTANGYNRVGFNTGLLKQFDSWYKKVVGANSVYFTKPFRTKVKASTQKEAHKMVRDFAMRKMELVIVNEDNFDKDELSSLDNRFREMQKTFDNANKKMKDFEQMFDI